MGIVMNMSSYEIERDTNDAEYGDEVAYSGWNPAVALMCQQVAFEQTGRRATIPASLAAVDAEAFLQQMYAASVNVKHAQRRTVPLALRDNQRLAHRLLMG